VTLRGDDDGDMTPTLEFDDLIEAVVKGDPVPEAHAALATFAQRVRVLGHGPAPTPTPELATLLAGRQGLERPQGNGRLAPTARRRGQLRRVVRLGLGASLAAAGVAGAGAAGVLPAAANNAVRSAIEAVSPLDIGRPAHPANHGSVISTDAKGDSDGEPGVDGRAVAESAPGAAHRADGAPAKPASPPGETGITGADRADETPAGTNPSATAPGRNGNGTINGNDDPGSPPGQQPGSARPDGRAVAGG
jgi:hypothetical protein